MSKGRAVIRALHELAERGTPTTIESIASYLKFGEQDVRAELLELRRARIFDDRRRKGQRVWLPWREVN